MTTLCRDLRDAVRLLRVSPAFTLVAALSLALGVGANTAIFSLVNEFLLRSLQVTSPDELVLFRLVEGVDGRMSRAGENNSSIDPVSGRSASTSFSLLMLDRFRAELAARRDRTAVSEVFAFAPVSQPHLLVGGQPEIAASAQLVSGSYYTGLGVPAYLGRTFTADDDKASAPPVAVITYRYWDTRFGRDPGAIGQTIALNRVAMTIVGVTPPGFSGAGQAGESPDVSVPLAHYMRVQPTREDRREPWYWWLRIMGRLAPGATAAQARAQFEPIFQEAARDGWLAGRSRDAVPRPMPNTPTLAVDSGAQGETNMRRQYAKSLYTLLGLAGLVLVAACANVANLLLARGASRRREIAMRMALGAGRGQIVRQLFVESLLLAAVGSVFGAVFAWWGRGLLLTLRPFGNTTVVLDLPIDVRVLGFTAAVAVATAILFGIAPALRASRVDLTAEFQGGARTLGGGSRSRLSQGLMVVQVALSLVLLVGTGLFVRTLRNLQAIDVGFDRRDLVMFQVEATSAGYARDQFGPLHARLQQRLERIPGVRTVTFSRVALLSRVRQNNRIAVTGLTLPADAAFGVNINGLAPNFFDAMGLPIVLGRGFTERDNASAPNVVVVNQALAQKYFGGENPIGREIVHSYGPFETVRSQVVGVAADAKYTDLRSAVPPTMYVAAAQRPGGEANFALRLAVPPGGLVNAIRAAVREIDPSLPVLNLRTLDEQIDRLHGQERLFARLSGFFGVLALGLASVGLYGLMSYAAQRRTNEIGLRIALGAVPAHVLRMMLGESLAIVGAGIAAGVAGAWASSRLVASMLYGLSPADPLTYLSVAIVLIVVALLASLLPALRASRVDPMTALRAE